MAKVKSPKSKKTALERAFVLIKQGWVRHASRKQHRNGGYSYCLTGALDAVASNGAQDEAVHTLFAALPQRHQDMLFIPDGISGNAVIARKRRVLQYYNDIYAKSKRDVTKVYKDAIKATK